MVRLTWLGQGGFLFEVDGTRLVVDPYLSGSLTHLTALAPPVIKMADVAPDLYVCTHVHGDHLDEPTVRYWIASSTCTFLGPASVTDELASMGLSAQRRVTLEPNQSHEHDALKIIAAPAKHTSPDAIGLLIQCGRMQMYLSGDTVLTPEIESFARGAAPVCVALVCINGKHGNMDHVDAARLVSLMQPRVAVPMHYGLFAENTADPVLFRDELEPFAIPCRFLQPGKPYAVTETGIE